MVHTLQVGHTGEIPTRYSHEVKTTQKAYWQTLEIQATLAKGLLQHQINIKHFSQH